MEPIVLGGTDQKPSKMELENRALARKAAAESFVLIQNDGTLPLKEKTLALYGSGARMTVKGGTGSGAVRERHSVSIAEGLLNAGYTISTTNWLDRFDKFYADTYEAYRQGVEEKVKGITSFYQMLGMAGQFRHPTGIPVEAQDYEADREAGVTTAIYVLARQAGEGAAVLLQQGLGVGKVAGIVHGHGQKAHVLRELAIELAQLLELAAAGAAPAGPHVHHGEIVRAEIRLRHRVPVQGLGGEGKGVGLAGFRGLSLRPGGAGGGRRGLLRRRGFRGGGRGGVRLGGSAACRQDQQDHAYGDELFHRAPFRFETTPIIPETPGTIKGKMGGRRPG